MSDEFVYFFMIKPVEKQVGNNDDKNNHEIYFL